MVRRYAHNVEHVGSNPTPETNQPTNQTKMTTLEATKPLTGFRAVEAWNKTWKHSHMPMWFKKALRRRAIRRGECRPNSQMAYCQLPLFFDHWGSFIPTDKQDESKPSRNVATMPYCGSDSEVKEFAEELGCQVECLPTGPWHPNTRLFIFSETNQKP